MVRVQATSARSDGSMGSAMWSWPPSCAGHSTPVEVLAKLANDENWEVRQLVAENPSTPAVLAPTDTDTSMTNFVYNFIHKDSSLTSSATALLAPYSYGVPCDVVMGEIGEPQREIEAPAPVRTPVRSPEPAPEREPQQEPVPA